jgi:hypothetical protein
MELLRDVRELEVRRERTQHERLLGDVDRQRARRVPLARLARVQPDPLHSLEEPLPLLLDQHRAEQVAEQADVAPERACAVVERGYSRMPR